MVYRIRYLFFAAVETGTHLAVQKLEWNTRVAEFQRKVVRGNLEFLDGVGVP